MSQPLELVTDSTEIHVELRPNFTPVRERSALSVSNNNNGIEKSDAVSRGSGNDLNKQFCETKPSSQKLSPVTAAKEHRRNVHNLRLSSDVGIHKERLPNPRIYDENVFTFKPKVSPQSVKIAESLGTDFMSRQQIHLDKQRRYFQQATLQFKSPTLYGRLSPVYKSRKNREKDSSEMPEEAKLEGAPSQESDGVMLSSDVSALASQSSPSLAEKQLHVARASKSSGQVNKMAKDKDEPIRDDQEFLMPPRSKTMIPHAPTTNKPLNRKMSNFGVSNVNLERMKNAKNAAERAIKNRRVFTIQGPYPAIRESLRRRGWVEKFYKLHMAPPPKKSPRIIKKKPVTDSNSDNDMDDDDDDDVDNATDDDDDEPDKIPPWEEDNGIYGIMSRTVRNTAPTFIWCVRRDAVDCKSLRKEQIINHYGKATFTTKVGLCMNLRNTPWFEPVDPEDFFPRCYRLSHDEEKQSFIEDYRITMCISILKWVVETNHGVIQEEEEEGANIEPTLPTSPHSPRKNLQKNMKKKKGGLVPMLVISQALQQCEKYINYRSHRDIDQQNEINMLSEPQWEEMLQNYYKLVFEDGMVNDANNCIAEAQAMLDQIQKVWPQFKMDGLKNVWIVKPGAKSRGRGIICYDRLEDMLKLVSSTVVKKDSKFVVQKYIERPLLIYNTKFDIRQWFLVTDWNPLTLWFYKDSYLRFCSQQFTLDNFNESIHLSNNAIQKYYDNGPRSSKLPVENMWSSNDFKEYLSEHGLDTIYDDLIYPGMKKAVLCSLLSTQDVVEYRKNGFELYGADFMLTEDYQPWLIEINSSPSMSYSTKVTADMCAEVLEDTIKVVVDRRFDKNADTGLFELAFKQPVVSVPPYIGINLTVEGGTIKRPSWMPTPKKEDPSKPVFTARPPAPLHIISQEKSANKDSHSDHPTPPTFRVTHSTDKTFMASKVASCISTKATVSTSNSGAGTSGTVSAPPAVCSTMIRPPSPAKLQLTSINLHTGSCDPVLPDAHTDGLWGRTCKECGSGMNLKLDSAGNCSNDPMAPRCWCQRDSVRMDPGFGARQPMFPFQRVVPPLATSYSIPPPLQHMQESLGPMVSPVGRVLNLPKRFKVDSNKLVASVYAKTGASTPPPTMAQKAAERIVLRYTDGGIQKPEFNSRLPQSATGFPKLITRYVSRRTGKSGMDVCTETYKQNPKLSIVSQSFI